MIALSVWLVSAEILAIMVVNWQNRMIDYMFDILRLEIVAARNTTNVEMIQ